MIDRSFFKRWTHQLHQTCKKSMIIIYHVNFVFTFFILIFIIFDDSVWRIDWKKKKDWIKITTAVITTTITTTKKKRSSKSRILNIYILINTAFFIYNNEKTFIIMTEIWNLIWRCMKSVNIFIITFITIVFAISKSSFAFAKRIYMMLILSNKHLQTVKRAEQIKNIYIWFLNADAKKKRKLKVKFIYMIINTIIINTRLLLTRFIMNY